ncbi:hypothetical protein [Myceligenerans pegani]|uniref:Uncharacterized protein n=1 Tax=Myceligenerans pegani TaxID=2776917 RepID=A0ABR9N0S8_9MICO|nr:hypothetical protein [Myceligenerans sp. TRM 65318]MBE1877259.1 hypothetical protein [Myceligenerans sp. TRM 65318]MBE3019530.1 hypothetical protein [Myceligenerans sp. TRM 65318]
MRATYRPMLAERIQETAERLTPLRALRDTLTTAVAHLDTLPDREEPCDASCALLNGPRRQLRLVTQSATTGAAPVACTLNGTDYTDYTERIAAPLLADFRAAFSATCNPGVAISRRLCDG